MSALFVKSIKFLIGGAFVFVLILALWGTVAGVITEPAEPTAAEEFHKAPEHLALQSDGMFGTFDEQQLQRGFQVYKEVCSACHSLRLATFRELEGIGYSEAQVKAIATNWAVKQPTFDPKTGDRGERDNVPADHFPTVYYPGQGSPPDLTLIAKAREGGPSYIYSLLTGYQEQPAELVEHFPASKTPDGLYYNPYFPNLNLAMPAPLTSEGQVEYLDGTRATIPQMAEDVSAFLAWSAEPTMEKRHATGFATILFLLALGILTFGAYRSVWAGVKH